jgi:hypothetical protein
MAAGPRVVSDDLSGVDRAAVAEEEARFRYPGGKRLPDRQALQGILFVLHTGVDCAPNAGGKARAIA